MENYAEKLEKLKKKYAEECKNTLIPEFKKIFDKYPQVKFFAWTQYSPHFNDGDECIFSANIDNYSLYINGVDGDGACDEYAMASSIDLNIPQNIRDEITKEICNITNNIGNEILEYMFGNHVKVTVYPNKIETENYTDHD